MSARQLGRSYFVVISTIVLVAANAAAAGCTTDWLVDAIKDGDLARVQELLDRGANPNQVVSRSDIEGLFLFADTKILKQTPVLILAVKTGNTEIIKALLDAGADSNAKTSSGGTALYYALEGGEEAPKLTTLLLEHGADPNQVIPPGEGVVLDRAISYGDLDTALVLFPVTDRQWYSDEQGRGTRSSDFGPLIFAVFDMFRREEMPIKAESLNALPVLTKAVLLHDQNAVEEILRTHPESVSERDRYEYTPLMWAASRFGQEELVELLLEAGADARAQGDGCWTALYAAVDAGSARCVRLLCKAGADPNAILKYESRRPPGFERQRRTLLMIATVMCRADVVQALLDGGADVNARAMFDQLGVLDCAKLNRTDDAKQVIQLITEALQKAEEKQSQ